MACRCCIDICDCGDLDDFYGMNLFITFGTFTNVTAPLGACGFSGQTYELVYSAPGGAGTEQWNYSGGAAGGEIDNFSIQLLANHQGSSIVGFTCLTLTMEYEDTDETDGYEGTGTGSIPVDGGGHTVFDECDPDLLVTGTISLTSDGTSTDECKGESASFTLYN